MKATVRVHGKSQSTLEMVMTWIALDKCTVDDMRSCDDLQISV
jgi:hypothetical protein